MIEEVGRGDRLSGFCAKCQPKNAVVMAIMEQAGVGATYFAGRVEIGRWRRAACDESAWIEGVAKKVTRRSLSSNGSAVSAVVNCCVSRV